MNAAMDDEDFELAHAERRRKRRRALWWLCGGGAAVFCTFAGLIVYSDAPEPDVSDLMPHPLVLRDDENLYEQLVAKGALLLAKPIIAEDAVDETVPKPAPPAGEGGAESEGGEAAAYAGGGGGAVGMFGMPINPEEWQPPKLRDRLGAGEGWTAERLALYGPALDAVAADVRDLLARYPQSQGTIMVDYNSVAPSKQVLAWGYHLRSAAWAKYRANEQIEAVERAVLGLRLGRKVRDSGGPLIEFFVGLGIMGLAEAPLEAWVNLAETEPATLRHLAVRLDELGAAGDLSEAYVTSLKVEFLLSHNFLRDTVTAEETAKNITGMGKAVDWVAKTRVLFPLIYKRNITVALNAENWREEIRRATVSLLAKKRDHAGGDCCPHCEALDAPWWQLANLYGRYLSVVVFPQLAWAYQSAVKAESRISLLRAAVALRLYSIDHDGALPGALSKLAPAYLPAVPRDFADGGEIRYSREARALWSVGVNALQITEPDQKIKDAEREAVFWLKFAESVEPTAEGVGEARSAGF